MNEEFYRTMLTELRDDIRRAEKEESDLLQGISVLQSRLRDMRRAATSISRMLGELTHESPDSDESEGDKGQVRHADVAEQVLRETKHALRVPEIGQRMIEKGHPLPVEERLRDSAVFAAMQRRPKVFERIARGLWALKEWKLNPSIAQPGLDFHGGESDQVGTE